MNTNKVGNIVGTNFPMDGEGRTYHLGLKKGELANYIITVGDYDRAKLIADKLERIRIQYFSNRGFHTYTGTLKGVEVSVVAIGMGAAMMDFFVREARAVVEGHMYIVRIGSCGTPREDIETRTVAVAKRSLAITTNYDALHDPTYRGSCYEFSAYPLEPDPAFHQLVMKKLQEQKSFPVIEATDLTADTFYASQGRVDSNFSDQNNGLIEEAMEKYPDAGSLQMETYYLYHLAKLNKKIHAAACAIVLANRPRNDFLPHEEKHKVEHGAGQACLEALVEMAIEVNQHHHLCEACVKGNLNTVKTMLESGVKPIIRNNRSPLHEVLKQEGNPHQEARYQEIIRMLIDHGAPLNESDGEHTALELAINANQLVRLTLVNHFAKAYQPMPSKSVKPEKIDEAAYLNLVKACEDGNCQEVQTLLGQGVYPGILSINGSLLSPLHEAITRSDLSNKQYNYKEIIRLLVQHGASINMPAPINMGYSERPTALQLAIRPMDLFSYKVLCQVAKDYAKM